MRSMIFFGQVETHLPQATTLVDVDLCYAVNDVNCVERTRLDAGAEAHAAECAGLRAACNTHCSVAVLKALVYSLVDCVAAAVALDVSDIALALSNLDAEHLCDLFRRSGAAYGAAVDRSAALDDRSSQAVAAREAAAAAVSTRQALAYQRDALVNLYGEDLSGYAEQDREYDIP